MTRHLASRLRELLRGNIRLTLTDNRRALIRARRLRTGYRLRLHRLFASADPAVLSALAMLVAGKLLPPSEEEVLAAFLKRTRRHIRERRPGKRRRLALCPYGAHHDLRNIADSVNQRYFQGRLEVGITWAQAARSRRRRKTISLGQYCFDRKVIFVHPSLDGRRVPRYVVENVVYHEMLHHVLGEEVVGKRRIMHSPEFRRLEQRYRKYRQAEAWKDRHLDRLLAYQP